jgi:60 kDa SS-A/Ro ribonucleoprotein
MEYDRLIVVTDEQSADRVEAQGAGYMINVARLRTASATGPWTHIDGFSEAVLTLHRRA